VWDASVAAANRRRARTLNLAGKFARQRIDKLRGDRLKTSGMGMKLIGPVGWTKQTLSIDQGEIFGWVPCQFDQQSFEIY
jgi:hypothetical protein